MSVYSEEGVTQQMETGLRPAPGEAARLKFWDGIWPRVGGMSDALYPIERAESSPTGTWRTRSILAAQLRRKALVEEGTIYITLTID